MTYDKIINKILTGDIFSEYSHANVVTQKNNRDFLQFDCSGFVAWYIGKNGYLRALAEIKKYLQQSNFLKINRFYCQDFKRFYKESKKFNYWNIHKNIMDIAPNDILVIVYDDNNGHTMIVDKILNKTDNFIELRIVDSTRLLHKNDTRFPDKSGIGYGEAKLTLDSDGVLYDPQNQSRTPTNVDVYVARPIK